MPLLILLGTVTVRGETPLNEARLSLEKWVETRQVLSRTRSDWQSDKEMLEQSIQLMERELKSVEEQMGKIGSSSAQVDKEREQAAALVKISEESLDKTRQFAVDFEIQLRKQLPQWPAPLQDLLKPLLNRLPASGVATRLPATERLQVLVGILSELDKFNNAVSIFNEKRKNAKSEEVAVQTLYIGLGAAYFVSDTLDFAGTGKPGASGWEWKIQNELAPSIHEAIRIYRNELPARFIALPAVIQ